MEVVSEESLLLLGAITIVLFIFITMVYPWMIGILAGECWRNARFTELGGLLRDMDNMNSGQTITYSITLGECVDKLILVHRDELRGVVKDYDKLECPSNALSMAVLEPDVKWYEIIKQQIVDPDCREIPCKSGQCLIGKDNTVTLEGPEKKETSKEYCLEVKKVSNTYYINTLASSGCDDYEGGGGSGGGGGASGEF